ncbi:Bug family tripartite tricarboxylate transporter substrate binding protein [Parapusillimonas granuli]|uniref:Tripartite tricarboxylate transporter substrate binding protein n=1 Tax=Parapusillimonas granuli TaxID=380911 RepID=A0A853FQX2_9BURK|nr:tripartite tricarboxylate transporter substrate binding protein [Parapusillimonas granuli]MBB5216529.1 tripartite-type tricarboxylate transporter receptor subunit TctC [Parapusillimonas granuli]NYT48165.1 tripartite tricarboxylate transporter substrate binding protein [Parapusillimonas granuli]
MNRLFKQLRLAGAVIGLACAVSTAHAETYPDRPVTIIVPYAHGGVTDLYARSIGDYLGRHWNTQVIVDNKGGAGTMIGTQHVSRAKPDGYTILLTSYAFTSNPILRKDLNYDPGSFEPVMLLGNSRSMLVVNSQSELKTLDDVIAKGKQSPGNLKFASSGNASSPHIAAELWAKEVGVTITHVPYKGTAPAMNDLYGGLVDGIFDGPSSINSVRAGRLRALGIAHDTRHPAAPEVPTFKEQGIDLVFGSWFGFLAPKGTPQPVLQKINRGLNDAIKDPQVRGVLDKAGLFVSGGTPKEFADFLAYESKRLQGLVDAGVQLVVQ